MADMESMRGITWSIYWKWALSSILAIVTWNIIGGFFMGLLAFGFDASTDVLELLSSVLKLVIWFTVSFFVLNYFLAAAVGKSIGGKRLELLQESTIKGEVDHAH